MQFYSQHGEDCLLWELFKDSKPGFFVDVGAMDGIWFSNTYAFELANWKGICIEAHPDYISLLEKRRPNSVVVHAAVHSKNKDVVAFYANKWGAFSTLKPELKEDFKKYGKWCPGWKKVEIPMRTLDSILEEYKINIPIDILSIDVEGTEIDVLKGFNINKYKPRVLIVEAMKKHDVPPRDKYMEQYGYFKAIRIGCNVIYCRHQKDVPIIAHAKIFPRESEHPLGNPETDE